MSSIEKRLKCLEQITADLFVRVSRIEDILFDATDRLRALEVRAMDEERADLVRDSPKVLQDLGQIDAILGSNQKKDKRDT
jgi:hypothetical protein